MNTGVKTSPWGRVIMDDLALFSDPTISYVRDPMVAIFLRDFLEGESGEDERLRLDLERDLSS